MSRAKIILNVIQIICVFVILAIADITFLSWPWFLFIAAVTVYGVANYKEGRLHE